MKPYDFKSKERRNVPPLDFYTVKSFTLYFRQCKHSIYKGYKRFFTLLTLYIQKIYKNKNKNIFNFIGVKLSKVSNFFRKANVYKGLERKSAVSKVVQKVVQNDFFQKIVDSIKIITIFAM